MELSRKETIILYTLTVLFMYMMVAMFSIFNGDEELPLSWVYHSLTDENLSLIQAWRDDFEKAIEFSREESYKIARELEENVR